MEKRIPRRADAVENAERVLEAARELYDELGVHAEMREVAARAGVGVGTVYRNFPTKDDLTNALLLDLLERWQQETLLAETIEDPFDALRYLFSFQQAMIDRHAWIMEVQVLSQVLRPDMIARLRELSDLHQSVLVRILQRAVGREAIRPDVDIPFLAAVLIAASHPQAFERMRNGRSTEQATEELLALFLRGIGPTPIGCQK